MNGINNYQVYNNYNRTTPYAMANEKTGARGTESSADKSKDVYGSSAKPSALSDDAKDLLGRLKKKYGNMDFIIANYDSEEEAQQYLAGGTKEFSVLLEPEVLEEMAADKDAEKKYTGMIDDATTKLADMKAKLGEDDPVTRMGITIGKDGSTSYFAELEKSGEKQKERIEKSRADKKEEAAKTKKAEAKKAEEERLRKTGEYATKRTMVTADTADSLLEKIRNVDWDAIKPEQRAAVGGVIDYGI